MPNKIVALIQKNRLVAIGLAGGGAFVGAQYFAARRPQPAPVAPVIIQGGGLDDATLAGLLANSTALGANAAVAGFQPGADVAIAGLNAGTALGASAINSLAGVAGTLAGSQASVAAAGMGVISDLGLGIIGALGEQQSGGGVGTIQPVPWPYPVPTNPPVIQPPITQAPGVLPPYYPPPVSQPPVIVPPVGPPTGSGPSGHVAIFQAPTLVYARHNDGTIGDHKTFGQSGLRIRVNPITVPVSSHGGGSFWRMTEGSAVGWLISVHDNNVTVIQDGPAGGSSASPGGAQVQVGSVGGVVMAGPPGYTAAQLAALGAPSAGLTQQQLLAAGLPYSWTNTPGTGGLNLGQASAVLNSVHLPNDLPSALYVASEDNPDQVQAVASSWYAGDVSKARQAIHNTHVGEVAAAAYTNGELAGTPAYVGDVRDPVTGYVTVGSIQAALASGRAHAA